jgi:hypothetical protein
VKNVTFAVTNIVLPQHASCRTTNQGVNETTGKDQQICLHEHLRLLYRKLSITKLKTKDQLWGGRNFVAYMTKDLYVNHLGCSSLVWCLHEAMSSIPSIIRRAKGEGNR